MSRAVARHDAAPAAHLASLPPQRPSTGLTCRENRTCAGQGQSDSLAGVPDVPGTTRRPAELADGSAKCRAALSRNRRQRALDEKHERLAELLRLALRMVEEK